MLGLLIKEGTSARQVAKRTELKRNETKENQLQIITRPLKIIEIFMANQAPVSAVNPVSIPQSQQSIASCSHVEHVPRWAPLSCQQVNCL